MNCGIKAGIVSIYQAESKGFATTQACKEIFNPNVASEEQIESEGGRHRTEVYAASRVPLILPIRLGRFGRVVWDAARARPRRASWSCLDNLCFRAQDCRATSHTGLDPRPPECHTHDGVAGRYLNSRTRVGRAS